MNPATDDIMWLMLVTVSTTVLSTVAKMFTIGYVSSLDIMEGSAINIAIESFKAKGWLTEHEFR